MAETNRITVNVDYGQYYGYGSDDFDESSVDNAMDGIVAPGGDGVRFLSGVNVGEVDVTVTVIDEPITFPTDVEAIASAFNLELSQGVFSICDWGGPEVYRHDFGHALRCGVLVEVHHRDEAQRQQRNSRPDEQTTPLREHHRITLSPHPVQPDRWRSRTLDVVGSHLCSYTDHVES